MSVKKKIAFFSFIVFVVATIAFSFAVLFLGGDRFIAQAMWPKKSVALISEDIKPQYSSPLYAFEIVDQSAYISLAPGEKGVLSLKLRNSGNTPWLNDGSSPVYLATGRPNERSTVFFKLGEPGWISGDRVKMLQDRVDPGEIAEFIFTVTAPKKSGIYREYFRPVVEHIQWLKDAGIYWDITVRGKDEDKAGSLSVFVSGKPEKYISVDISDQRLRAYENGLEKFSFITSTGRVGMDTPLGEFSIHNKFPTAYSKPYDLYMDNWMAITPDGVYGLHSLPYWKLKSGGRLYEGEGHLGTKVSHGCIRTGIEQSRMLYDWASVGTKVYIQE